VRVAAARRKPSPSRPIRLSVRAYEKRKWRNLRDTFLKEKKKIKKCCSGDSQENAEIYTGKWNYYKLMLFLNDITTPKNTDGNISNEENTQLQNSELTEIEENEHFSDSFTNICSNNNDVTEIEQHVSRPELETDSFITPTTVLPNTSSASSNCSQSSSIKRKKKQSNNDFESELLKLEERILTALLQSNVNPVKIDDNDMLFLKSLHPYFSSMNPLQKLRIRNQIQNVFINELSTQPQQPPSFNEEISYPSSTPYLHPYSSQQIHC
jgi:hypothetical protein